MENMKAVNPQLRRAGSAPLRRCNAPTPGAGELLIKVHAAYAEPLVEGAEEGRDSRFFKFLPGEERKAFLHHVAEKAS